MQPYGSNGFGNPSWQNIYDTNIMMPDKPVEELNEAMDELEITSGQETHLMPKVMPNVYVEKLREALDEFFYQGEEVLSDSRLLDGSFEIGVASMNVTGKIVDKLSRLEGFSIVSVSGNKYSYYGYPVFFKETTMAKAL